MNPGCRIHPGAFAKLIHRGNSSPPPRSIIAFFRGFPPWWRDGPASPSPHIRFHGRDARKYRQGGDRAVRRCRRSEEHTSELQSLMRISYAVFCLKKNKPTLTVLPISATRTIRTRIDSQTYNNEHGTIKTT